jgi:hypothetical protein
MIAVLGYPFTRLSLAHTKDLPIHPTMPLEARISVLEWPPMLCPTRIYWKRHKALSEL